MILNSSWGHELWSPIKFHRSSTNKHGFVQKSGYEPRFDVESSGVKKESWWVVSDQFLAANQPFVRGMGYNGIYWEPENLRFTRIVLSNLSVVAHVCFKS